MTAFAGDFAALDRQVAAAVDIWRARMDALARMTAPEPALATSPLPEALVDPELASALAERAGDRLAAALSPWVAVLRAEHALYPERFQVARAWAEPRALPERPDPISPRELLHELLSASHPVARSSAAADLARVAGPIGDRAAQALERRCAADLRLPAECRSLAVAELPCGPAVLAERLLARTDDLAAERAAGPWQEGLCVGLGRGAGSGWPARLTRRWLGEVLARGFERGLHLDPALLPPQRLAREPAALGALSYARALGALGVRLLEACRPAALPLCLHQHPSSMRKHLRRALFASIVAEPSFSTRILGLGKGAARDQRRAIARAMLVSLRIDAWRVLCLAAAAQSLSAARERYREIGERVLGHGLPPLLSVVPRLRPADGAALCGAMLAWPRRAELLDRHDEDWFRNPRALDELRAEACLPREEAPIAREAIAAAIEAIAREAERAIG